MESSSRSEKPSNANLIAYHYANRMNTALRVFSRGAVVSAEAGFGKVVLFSLNNDKECKEELVYGCNMPEHYLEFPDVDFSLARSVIGWDTDMEMFDTYKWPARWLRDREPNLTYVGLIAAAALWNVTHRDAFTQHEDALSRKLINFVDRNAAFMDHEYGGNPWILDDRVRTAFVCCMKSKRELPPGLDKLGSPGEYSSFLEFAAHTKSLKVEDMPEPEDWYMQARAFIMGFKLPTPEDEYVPAVAKPMRGRRSGSTPVLGVAEHAHQSRSEEEIMGAMKAAADQDLEESVKNLVLGAEFPVYDVLREAARMAGCGGVHPERVPQFAAVHRAVGASDADIKLRWSELMGLGKLMYDNPANYDTVSKNAAVVRSYAQRIYDLVMMHRTMRHGLHRFVDAMTEPQEDFYLCRDCACPNCGTINRHNTNRAKKQTLFPYKQKVFAVHSYSCKCGKHYFIPEYHRDIFDVKKRPCIHLSAGALALWHLEQEVGSKVDATSLSTVDNKHLDELVSWFSQVYNLKVGGRKQVYEIIAWVLDRLEERAGRVDQATAEWNPDCLGQSVGLAGTEVL